MKRLISMYLYRFVRSISIWVCLSFSFMIVLLPSLSRFIITTPDSTPFSAAESLLSAASSGFPMMLCGIGLAIFFHADEKNGYIKNIMPLLSSPAALIGARLVISAVMALAMYLLIYVQLVLVSLLIFRGYISFTAAQFGAFWVAFLLTAAFLSLITLLTILSRGTSLPIVCDVICCTGLISLLCILINMLINRFTPFHEFNLSQYIASGCLLALEDTGTHLREIIVAVCYLLVTSAAGILTLRHRDTR